MEPTQRPRSHHVVPVDVIMSRMADGDTAAVFTLAAHHGSRIAGVVRRQLRRCGVDHVTRDDLDGLVLDACMVLREIAAGWRPGGALPWWWAEGRIRSVVNAWVGVHADPLDDRWSAVEAHTDRHAPPVAASDDESVSDTFARLVQEMPLMGLVSAACRAAHVDDRSLECLLDYSIQQHQGDPSPAHTLAGRYGVSPQTLRKRISRDRQRLRAVVESDPRFVDLAGFRLVA